MVSAKQKRYRAGQWFEYVGTGDQALAHFRLWKFGIEYVRTGVQKQLTIGW